MHNCIVHSGDFLSFLTSHWCENEVAWLQQSYFLPFFLYPSVISLLVMTHRSNESHTRMHIRTHTHTHSNSSGSTTINAPLSSNWKQVPLFQSEKYYCFSSLVFLPSTLLGVLIKVGRRMFEDSSVSCQRLLQKANTEALSHTRNTNILCTLSYYLGYFLL